MLKRLEFYDFYQTEESKTLKTLTYVQYGFCKELQVKSLAPRDPAPHTTTVCKHALELIDAVQSQTLYLNPYIVNMED